MIKSIRNWQGYRNEITDYLDEFLLDGYARGCDADSNYIYDRPVVKSQRESYWGIRVPGATRGEMLIEDGIIKNIKLYEDTFCYKREVLDNIDKFYGKAIDLTIEKF